MSVIVLTPSYMIGLLMSHCELFDAGSVQSQSQMQIGSGAGVSVGGAGVSVGGAGVSVGGA